MYCVDVNVVQFSDEQRCCVKHFSTNLDCVLLLPSIMHCLLNVVNEFTSAVGNPSFLLYTELEIALPNSKSLIANPPHHYFTYETDIISSAYVGLVLTS